MEERLYIKTLKGKNIPFLCSLTELMHFLFGEHFEYYS